MPVMISRIMSSNELFPSPTSPQPNGTQFTIICIYNNTYNNIYKISKHLKMMNHLAKIVSVLSLYFLQHGTCKTQPQLAAPWLHSVPNHTIVPLILYYSMYRHCTLVSFIWCNTLMANLGHFKVQHFCQKRSLNTINIDSPP